MNVFRTSSLTLAATVLLSPVLLHAQATNTDKTFVAKVSQGGQYEVEASKLAEQRAHAQDVKDLAVMEVHDHTLVGEKLKRIANAAGVTFPATLNAEFQQRLDNLKSTPPDQFDAAYLEDMKKIHDGDEKLFAQESHDGSGAFKPFAAETDLIVKRHIGALHGTDH
jgi:putative membrane protein